MGAGSEIACAICATRRPRRYCPGVNGDICPICCGTERENTVNCPLDCPYLCEARARERDPEVEPGAFAHPEIKVDEQFLRRNEPLLVIMASGLALTALAHDDSLDTDVREALDSLVRTYMTLQSGLVYEVRPENPIAARIQDGLQQRIREIESELKRNGASLRDSDVLGVLVFLQRLETQKNNRRRKSRAFIDFLREFFPPEPVQTQPQSNLILP